MRELIIGLLASPRAFSLPRVRAGCTLIAPRDTISLVVPKAVLRPRAFACRVWCVTFPAETIRAETLHLVTALHPRDPSLAAAALLGQRVGAQHRQGGPFLTLHLRHRRAHLHSVRPMLIAGSSFMVGSAAAQQARFFATRVALEFRLLRPLEDTRCMLDAIPDQADVQGGKKHCSERRSGDFEPQG